jgi:GT2 family glycosyltransferase
MTKALTVVMPCHNRRDALQLALESLCQQTYPLDGFEVIVVDQASTDGSRELVRSIETSFELRLLEQDAMYGISVSRNAGAEAAASPLVLYLDADHVAGPNVVQAHVACHAAYPEQIACGRTFPYPPAYRSFVERAANPEAGLDRGDYEGPMPYYQAYGNNLSLSVATFRRIGPYDIHFKRLQDIEYACRAHQMGIGFVNCPLAISYHNHPRSLRDRCEYAATVSAVPLLLERYPDLRGVMPGLRDFEPIDWRHDSAWAVQRKLRARFYGLAAVRWSFYQMLLLLNRYEILPRLAKALYWRLVQDHGFAGFSKGLAQTRGKPVDGSA